MAVGFIHKLNQCSFKFSFPSHTTGMITLKEMVICLIVFSTYGAINCVLDWVILVDQRVYHLLFVKQIM
jgi:hypothetical protein